MWTAWKKRCGFGYNAMRNRESETVEIDFGQQKIERVA
jgi:hypothetical protein